MFSTKEQLIKKTGKHGIGRFDFLQQLVNEYNVTKSRDSKEQVLANLANFAYDPVNYDYLWRLKVIDVFLIALDERSKKLVKFAIGGVCNICLEPLSREYILRNDGVKRVAALLSRKDEDIILSTITTLIFLDTPKSRQDIVAPEIVERMKELSKSTSARIKNLADVFLQDLCGITENRKIFTGTLRVGNKRLKSVGASKDKSAGASKDKSAGASSSSFNITDRTSTITSTTESVSTITS